MQKLSRVFYVLCEIACVLLAVMMAFFIATNNSPLFLEIGGDNAIFLTVGKAIAMGRVPYVDIVENKGPVLFLLNALPQFFMEGTLGVFIIEAMMMVGATLLLLHMARRLQGEKRSALCAVVPVGLYFATLTNSINSGNFGEEYNLFLLVVALWALVRALCGETRRQWASPFLLGLSACCIALIKISDLPACCVIILFYLIWMGLEKRGFWKDCLACVAGVALIAVPVFIYLGVNGAIGPMFEEYILSNFSHVGGAEEMGFVEARVAMIARGDVYAHTSYAPVIGAVIAALVAVACWLLGGREKEGHPLLMACFAVAFNTALFADAYISLTGYGQHLIPLSVGHAVNALVALCAVYRLIARKTEALSIPLGLAGILVAVLFINSSIFSFHPKPYANSREMAGEYAYQREFYEYLEWEPESVFCIGVPRKFYVYNEVLPAYKCINLVNYIYNHVGENRDTDFEAYLMEEPIYWLVVQGDLENYRGILTDETIDFIYENYVLFLLDHNESRQLYQLI
ncbi:MAG: hypothetical protein IJ041_04535 [Clostridia bacterium]|nr:hypothetical protein [Clostridia bacterium]